MRVGHLSATMKAWVEAISATFALEAHHEKLLLLAALAWDRGEIARKVLDRDGLTFLDKKGCPRPRPENAIARDCAVVFARLCRELRLDDGPSEEPRPPRLVQSNGHRRQDGGT